MSADVANIVSFVYMASKAIANFVKTKCDDYARFVHRKTISKLLLSLVEVSFSAKNDSES